MAAEIKAVVLTISDSASRGEREDRSGPALIEELREIGGAIVAAEVLPDDRLLIAERLRYYAESGDVNLILTTGGTGLSPRDHTPEATLDVIEREVPGIPEAMRGTSVMMGSPLAILTRAVAGIRCGTLIINLPGSVRGVKECFAAIRRVLPHALETLAGKAAECGHPAKPNSAEAPTSESR